MLTMSNSVIDEGRPGWFHIATNKMQAFEIGVRKSSTLWLAGLSVGTADEPEFVFNGRLYLPSSPLVATIFDNFPRAPAPHGWKIQKHVHFEGYDLVSEATGETIFGFLVRGSSCLVTTNLYGAQKELWAETTDDTLKLFRGPAKLGTHGIYLQ